MRNISVTVLLFIAFYCNNHAQTDSDFIAGVDSGLAKLVELKDRVKEIHPLLDNLHPVAVVKQDEIFIFDIDSSSGKYKFIKKEPVPFPMPEGIKASFPLSSYNWKPSCVIGKETFSSLSGYALIFHEFIHCSQYNSVEPEIKNTLEINKQAMEKKDYSWELNFAFPYEDTLFISSYEGFINSLERKDYKAALNYRSKLKEQLSNVEFEYLVWEEWKEGFARYIENKIRLQLEVKENTGGKEKPYNRVAFYYGGSLFINHLTDKDKSFENNLEELFNVMVKY